MTAASHFEQSDATSRGKAQFKPQRKYFVQYRPSTLSTEGYRTLRFFLYCCRTVSLPSDSHPRETGIEGVFQRVSSGAGQPGIWFGSGARGLGGSDAVWRLRQFYRPADRAILQCFQLRAVRLMSNEGSERASSIADARSGRIGLISRF
jgi:hypothetical protein